jgi:hypothetical protein
MRAEDAMARSLVAPWNRPISARLQRFVPALVATGLALGGCGGGDDAAAGAGSGGSGGTAGSGTSATCDAPDGQLFITDDTNYSLPSTLRPKQAKLKDATDLEFDWGGLEHDFYGRDVDARVDIDLVLVSLWRLTPDELTKALQHDALSTNDSVGVITTYPKDDYTSQNLLAFDYTGNPIPEGDIWRYFDTQDPDFHYPADTHTFLVIAETGTVLGKGGRMLTYFTLDPASSETKLTIDDDSAQVAFDVELARARPVHVPSANPAITLNWGKMEKNALGNPYDWNQINDAVVAHFTNETLEDLENDFLNLESLAEGWWKGEVQAGKSIDLSTLSNAAGESFPGIDGEGIWLTALFCTINCGNPAPWSISILQPCH